jgi:hypothetical protein
MIAEFPFWIAHEEFTIDPALYKPQEKPNFYCVHDTPRMVACVNRTRLVSGLDPAKSGTGVRSMVLECDNAIYTTGRVAGRMLETIVLKRS